MLPMWIAFSLGVFADNMLRQALIIGIGFGAISAPGFENGAKAIPVVGALFAVAMLVFSPIAGQVADRFETSMMLRLTKFIEILVMAAAAVGFFIGSGAILIGALFAMGAQSAFFSPVRIGAMPKYLARDELVRGNAYFQAGLFASLLIGLFLGGALIEREGGGAMISAILLAASILGWIAVRGAPPAPADAPALRINFNIPAQAISIIGFALRAPGVAPPLLGVAAFFYISTLMTVLLPLYIPAVWSGGGGVANAVMGLFAVGAGLGALSAALLARGRSGFGFSFLGVAAAMGASFAIFALGAATAPAPAGKLLTAGEFFARPGAGALAALFAGSAATLGLYVVPLQAAVQRRAPADHRSRVMAAGNMLNALAAIAGSLSVLSVTNAGLSPNAALLLVGLLQSAIALTMALRWTGGRARAAET